MDTITILKKEMQDVLQNNILSYWERNMIDPVNGGFFGRITAMDEVMPEADKGAILNTRILWTFSAAYRLFGKKEYLDIATRAKDYILQYFLDKKYGGIYWSLDYKGNPKDTKKQIYALGFAVYGMSEYYRATKDRETLDCAVNIFHSIEKYSFDSKRNGYYEALTQEWGEIADMRLSEKDANEKKTMNTHLHILEPYTNLYRVWKNDLLKKQLANLINVFIDKILDSKTNHLGLFFDEDWKPKSNIVSYGHDIEASWLLHEAALVLGDEAILKKVESLVPAIVEAASEGLCEDGSMIYERDEISGHMDRELHWWVQAEAVVGYVNMYQYFQNKDALQKAFKVWQYIKNHFIDYTNGEWFWSIKEDGSINRGENGDKAGFWKCPYHNSRMCMEIFERFPIR